MKNNIKINAFYFLLYLQAEKEIEIGKKEREEEQRKGG
jgi:hypothetical protein